jgi:hypothetical protein
MGLVPHEGRGLGPMKIRWGNGPALGRVRVSA